MSDAIQVTEIDVSLLSEGVRTEAERVVSQACTTLLQRYFVSDEYAILQLCDDSKPDFRTLVTLSTGVVVPPGDAHQVRFRLLVDEAGEPAFQVVVYRPEDPAYTPVVGYIRFTEVGDLFQVNYTRSYQGFKDLLKEDTNITLMISDSFHTSSNASCHENSIHFEVVVD